MSFFLCKYSWPLQCLLTLLKGVFPARQLHLIQSLMHNNLHVCRFCSGLCIFFSAPMLIISDFHWIRSQPQYCSSGHACVVSCAYFYWAWLGSKSFQNASIARPPFCITIELNRMALAHMQQHLRFIMLLYLAASLLSIAYPLLELSQRGQEPRKVHIRTPCTIFPSYLESHIAVTGMGT